MKLIIIFLAGTVVGAIVGYMWRGRRMGAFVMSPYIKTCSTLLKKEAKEKIIFMNNLRKKLEYK